MTLTILIEMPTRRLGKQSKVDEARRTGRLLERVQQSDRIRIYRMGIRDESTNRNFSYFSPENASFSLQNNLIYFFSNSKAQLGVSKTHIG